MTAPDDSPAALLRFKIGTRHHEEGIEILDDAGQRVALVLASHPHAQWIADLFANSPKLFYGISRARGQLRAIVKRQAQPDDASTLAVRQLLREVHEPLTTKKS